ncbi:hypothetical protein J2W68_001429 [Luteimonas terrae]|uniref:DNA-binding protein n=1 Tax=Luteimonas terrae TaxID=1530191 RepID=A0ABU1XVE6_9GAMM|nr:hypothetical protein [Luteimonas terrae]
MEQNSPSALVPVGLLQRLAEAVESMASTARCPSDWMTEAEAAAYCRVSVSAFRAGYMQLGVVARSAFGRKLYSRDDLHRAIANSPAWGGQSEPSHSGLVRASIHPLLTNLRPERQRPYKPRKKPAEPQPAHVSPRANAASDESAG